MTRSELTRCAGVLGTLLSIGTGNSVSAATVVPLTFYDVATHGSIPGFESQVVVDVVSDTNGSIANFTFSKTSHGGGSLIGLYFEEGLDEPLGGFLGLTDSGGGVNFSVGENSSGFNIPDEPLAFSTNPWDGNLLWFESRNHGQGLNIHTEWLTISFTTTATEADLVSAIMSLSGNSRIAGIVRGSLAHCGMDKFCGVTAVPLPSAVWLLGSSLVGLLTLRRSVG